jgi:phosphate transport system protein
MRRQFDNKLSELRDEILKMGSMVDQQLQQALKALEESDKDLARQVVSGDSVVNAKRFEIEDRCIELIATQQPVARDLRVVVAVMNMIVDLERMGDQVKGIAKIVPRLAGRQKIVQPPELKQMGEIVSRMLNQCIDAYAQNSIDLARLAANQDTEVDALYTRAFSRIMESMTEAKKEKKVKASYDVLRVAQELERFGDLTTNIAERIIYIATGKVQEVNTESDIVDG